MITRVKFVLLSLLFIIIMLSAINSFKSLIAGYVTIGIYILIISIMIYKRLKFEKMKKAVEQAEINSKYKELSKNDK